VAIIGTEAAGGHFDDPALRTLNLQKGAFFTGLTLRCAGMIEDTAHGTPTTVARRIPVLKLSDRVIYLEMHQE
jgi:hypothetical protein